MITIKTNLSTVLSGLDKKILALANTDQLLRTVATNMQAGMKKRIHEDGKASDGSDIGTYSPGYMTVRTGQFKSNGKITRGKNKGQQRTAGVYTKGKNKGKARFNYNRTNDTRVVSSLTRQQENDLSVLATPKGYGIGYHNEFNAKKAEYVEKTYRKKIFSPTEQERIIAIETAKNFVHQTLNG